MLIAVFGPSTALAGKKLTREGDFFILEEHGPISAQDVMEHDRQGHLVWATHGMRARVSSLVPSALPVSQPEVEARPPGAMLIATFRPTTAWSGKRITFEDQQFILEGHGPVSAQAIMEYDHQGNLDWATDGTRAWVGSRGSSAPPLQQPGVEARPPGAMLIATFGPTTAWVGKTISFEKRQFILEGHGRISAQAVMEYDRQGHLVWANQSSMADEGSRAWLSALLAGRVPAQGSLNDKLIWWAALSPLWLWLLIPLSAILPIGFGVSLVPFIFLMIDLENVKKAGVESRWLVLWALFLPPGYIFVRQRRANRSLTAFFVSAVLWFFPIVVSFTAVWRAIWG